MKWLYFGFLILFTVVVQANEVESLNAKQLEQQVQVINELQNVILMKDSKVADVDALFAHFTDNFEYIHEVYGGTYTKEHLYNNYVKFLKAGRYQNTSPRYKITNMIVGHDAVSVEREQVYEGQIEKHLTVFEFKHNKVAKIIEYWK
ncbi:hypothetical protein PSECIP111951_02055 [Pseudoalteromonas holothuriae]|uniref:SnoaL-like domain-containing protein n=1 Tax=Pseudoalteromonas holothuriae TaxID=2963714 RepID=A0A9W4QV90_9GAMM|nr:MULTISPECIES: hypothetical protein [unclassified Pseudoalteromonas]CAH9054753.1 hypothetical protein PSECIP111854_01438 [Pseudoalteromonas sp. CIP111854]CAH9059346.1 hypothetical protein PSECIP111951_02055 [Pseudoalteromonas sp. CIP111951]